MQLVEQHIINDDRFKDWCVKAKNLYNQTLYYWRQSVFGNIQYFSEYELVELMQEYNEENFRALPANTSQQIIKVLFKNVKSWQKARKEFLKNPSKFLGRPKLPKYKKELSQLYFTSNQVKLKNGFIHFPKMIGIAPMKTKIPNINCCRVIPRSNHFVVEFVYTIDDVKQVEPNDNIMGIDLGLNNLATTITTNGVAEIINGKPLKAINHFYNKRKSQLQSLLPKNKFKTNRIERLTFSRNQKIKDYVHKASRHIVEKAKELNVSKIVIGNNKNWKQGINLKKNTNREFTSIPHSQLIEKIEYKAKLSGIEVVTTEESYTSKCSSYDLEPVQKHEKYLGKRTKRGLFRTAQNKYINADVNGACNILRKVSEDTVLRHIDSVRSVMVTPKKAVKLYNLHNRIKSLSSN